ncbi:hypothetical protein [Notoacmeibacter sp. MSK16QG-6]|uniref:hypothetical protein n=1 Tax=Notoacmeibacter sp. MSK16QG-6 TaxID=2957982 RepID=UPI0020A16CA9|nr:hypothetical protein [Notoacmeibacter sp. MSK16QG-6]MCP1198508.1 hypothetical protein [Notoacmeibacter sp. MSK16QG-6]
MNHFSSVRAIAALAALAALAGCGLQGPTYGTGKGANVQLLEDVTSMVDLTPKKGEPIAYQPRPELVTPPALAANGALPAPQQDATQSADWVESPEERRKRYRDYATENRDDVNFRPVVAGPRYASTDAKIDASSNPERLERMKAQRAEYQRRKRIASVGDADQRRFLSEPPTDYRVPADSAPTGELGEDEKAKAARLAKEAGVKKKKRFIFF